MNYNFKKFFSERTPIHNDEWVTNGHFLIKKSELKKSQLNYINDFPQEESTINSLKTMIKNESEKDIITEFIPETIAEVNQIKPIETTYNVVIMERDRGYKGCNENISVIHISLKEEYYNFIQNLKCKVFIVNNDAVNPLSIYNSNNEFVGIVLPHRTAPEVIKDANSYKEYIEKQEIEQMNKDIDKKEKSKKCLYISNNKAMIRYKQLTCIADLLQDEKYRNVYVEENKNSYGEVFVDLGIICMGTGRTLNRKTNAEGIEYSMQNLATTTLQDYKEYITKCLNNNQFINVAEIKLMELAGESPEYIQRLIEHRQKVLDLREQEHREREQKRQQEEQEYIEKKNNEVAEMVAKAEQSIVNKEKMQNKDITVYKSRYESNSLSLVLYLMKQYDINIPLKTQGWINNALADIFYDKDYNEWTYTYYTSSANSTVFQKYLNELVKKVNEKYSKVA